MKKIYATLVSLLFVVSVSGIASAMANESCECQITGPASAHIGDTFQVVIKENGSCCITYLLESPFAKLIDVETIPDGYILTYEALKIGTEKIANCGTLSSDCKDVVYYVAILPKVPPMDQIMKILEKNKNK